MASTLYFAYGSNLWKHQMAQRCPTSAYSGIARLKSYRWIIYERGYANIIETNHKQSESSAYADEVWGLVFSLQPSDVRKLDINEGVPFAYEKENLTVDFWQAHDGKPPNPDEKPKQVEMLVYINRRMTTPSKPKKEYIYRMNQGIKDALKEGMPLAYVDAVMRKFIPDVEDEKVAEVAKKQALGFEEE
ncbi:hypothetical protein LTR91_012122 [Friedmanniomyces endolithicus]|uniref:gamma-glutamylcyclotransferase n=1 Tax=Friedmanniomyces endolithicus TaxID=329885 RepID=A0AAN6QR50_9PEZI|nr:hypothetical protein LTS09_005092 [Friedmanniomyces endolithicus]KAK0290442.1 hypothetical protein LTR35_002385 [Friedmanniomyces endolithicus]KAK0295853.1 hypothetical protein LTS00_005594 [Friedmanniomyces endolithicus]KAK0308989.1 hypothetical protein LTR01_004870 [Friedmanniomyces endolithicus]KAK0325824.1 hypothetical protein LTR82_003363 [Friedmanniomyces endolithicus]